MYISSAETTRHTKIMNCTLKTGVGANIGTGMDLPISREAKKLAMGMVKIMGMGMEEGRETEIGTGMTINPVIPLVVTLDGEHSAYEWEHRERRGANPGHGLFHGYGHGDCFGYTVGDGAGIGGRALHAASTWDYDDYRPYNYLFRRR